MKMFPRMRMEKMMMMMIMTKKEETLNKQRK